MIKYTRKIKEIILIGNLFNLKKYNNQIITSIMAKKLCKYAKGLFNKYKYEYPINSINKTNMQNNLISLLLFENVKIE